MNNLTKRILLFVIAIPGLSALILFGNVWHYLPVNLLVIILGALGSYEMAGMFHAMDIPVNKTFLTVSGALIPAITWMQVIGMVNSGSVLFFITLLVILIFVISLKPADESFAKNLPVMSASIMTLFYPGVFLSYITRITSLPESPVILLIFMCIVYLNDSNAWLFGMLWGKKSRGFVAVSPNKSLIGFFGGVLASVIVAVSSRFIFPEIITGSIPLLIGLGIVAGVTGIIGDLVESAMKRSSGVKDSGSIIPGRGGMLDSIDSLIFAAPGFYYVILLATAGL
ncbi:MAG: phosphatidate cytidylyltransferase [Spirochaetales bacterium]|nr:phosphatidate cytidylyltransferase [Spirochaetales bacterium]